MRLSGFFYIFMTESITPDCTQVLVISSYVTRFGWSNGGNDKTTFFANIYLCISFFFIYLQTIVTAHDVFLNLKRTS